MNYLKGAALSFILFSLYLYFTLLNGSSEGEGIWYEAYVMGFLLVYTICFATEMFIKLAETQWHRKKFDWLIIPATCIISFPFLHFPPLYISIFVGAFGFFIGRRLPNNRFILSLTPLPLLFLAFFVIVQSLAL
ncbi:hypothetical protein [Fictibacillus barbaricus]|uniref:Prepilin type IV endopeptidase peptidase domain-containing protein n=1 Tax=Fictibacillus barbaricus TaxID=182136 RepID=A0ABU1TW16_9BACL|nr:hypothetical protein [Fictibacillus barbaricus]MDR7071392.1 hypothetical protein [Fictibacillus barbaricus]